MYIDRITFTGSDDKINYQDLIQRNHIGVEFGILFSKSKMGTQRYPTLQWILGLPNDLALSAHLCGYYSKKAIEEGVIDLVPSIYDKFKRFQINYNFQSLEDVERIEKLCSNYSEKNFILQFNKGNADVVHGVINKSISNIHILFDSSGGRGTQIATINPPFGNIYTGYSGGINPENVKEISDKIKAIDIHVPVFIDTESGVRTNNELDFDKVDSILKALNV